MVKKTQAVRTIARDSYSTLDDEIICVCGSRFFHLSDLESHKRNGYCGSWPPFFILAKNDFSTAYRIAKDRINNTMRFKERQYLLNSQPYGELRLNIEVKKMPYKEREFGGPTFGGKETKVNDTIEGKIIEMIPNANATEKNKLVDYMIDTGKETVRVWGSSQLLQKIRSDDVGKKIRIKYRGKIKVKRGNAKDYKVEVSD